MQTSQNATNISVSLSIYGQKFPCCLLDPANPTCITSYVFHPKHFVLTRNNCAFSEILLCPVNKNTLKHCYFKLFTHFSVLGQSLHDNIAKEKKLIIHSVSERPKVLFQGGICPVHKYCPICIYRNTMFFFKALDDVYSQNIIPTEVPNAYFAEGS